MNERAAVIGTTGLSGAQAHRSGEKKRSRSFRVKHDERLACS
jgi:hypothetical protein